MLILLGRSLETDLQSVVSSRPAEMSLEAAGPLEPGPERWWRLLVGDANLTNLIRDSGGVHVHTPAQPGHTEPLGSVLSRNIFS